MDRGEIWGRESVTGQLHHGMQLTNKLKKQLHHSSSSSCGFLIEEIVSCYDNALALLHYMDSLQTQVSTTLVDFSPTTDVSSDQDFKDHVVADVPKKRKSLSRWSEEVLEDQHKDGFNWRKYGQKDILGATHPRSYYRCTHRRTQGCLATKQVQRGEDDPRIFKVVYRGKHSCVLKLDKENASTKEPQQSKPEKAGAEPLSEPRLESHFSTSPNDLKDIEIEHSFRNTDELSLWDWDFLIDHVDFDGCFVDEYFS